MNLQILSGIKSLILDMDGVLWRESAPIGDLPHIFQKIKQLNLKVVLATNNATRTPRQYVEKLASFGVEVTEDQVINSSMGVAYLLSKRFPDGGSVYVVGESGLVQALEDAGFHQSEDNCLAVIVSMDRNINFEKMKKATLLIRSGVPFYGTNPDRTYPTPRGLIPGAGAIIGAIEIATDVAPIIAGKPNPTLYEFALERLGTTPQETLIVGDRLETDVTGGQRLGCPTALVLSGIATREQAERHQPAIDFIVPTLGDLVNLFDER
ncbi:MAG: HAD-IIA family hydrolase [Anaerolineaceae bacterium]|nr:HAD-IIA family hydrolase [Anaerolineaceae bacterium]